MHTLARQRPQNTVSQELGTVVRMEGTELVVHTATGEWRARRALSCLVAPSSGDRVLLAIVEPEGCFVLAILNRDRDRDGEASPPTVIALEGDVSVSLPTGRLDISAQRGASFTCGQDFSVVAGEFNITAAAGNFLIRQLDLIGDTVRTHVDQLKTIAQSCDSVFDRVVQRVKNSYRFVAESEQLRAERIDYVAEESLALHAKDTLITAEQLIKADGAQVHIG